MKREEKYLIECLRRFLNEEKTKTPDFVNFSWKYFQKLTQIHGVGGMVYVTVKEAKHFPAEEMKQLKHQFDFAVSRAVRRDMQIAGVEAALCNAEIPHVFFKGYELCRYYPVPEVRIMSDIDMLIRKEDCARIETVLETAGCVQQSKNYKGYVYVKNDLLMEIHTEFGGEPENGADYNAWVVGGFAQGEFKDNNYTGYLRHPYHFTYLVYHAAKHFNSTGAGIRMFLDVAVFWKRYGKEMDRQEIWDGLKAMRLDLFAGTVFWLCNTWFGTDIPWTNEPGMNLRKDMEEYIFSGGVFGHQKRSISDVYVRKAVTEKNSGNLLHQKVLVMIRYFFPGRKQMERFLPKVKKYPFLLPAAWIVRWYQGLFLRKTHSVKVIKGITEGNAEAEKEYRMLKSLGLEK